MCSSEVTGDTCFLRVICSVWLMRSAGFSTRVSLAVFFLLLRCWHAELHRLFCLQGAPLASSRILQEDVVHQSRDWSGVIRLRTCKNARKRISRGTFDRLVQTVHGLARTLQEDCEIASVR